ncbi:MAG: MmgE/PrpD family protein [Jatrophihabitantaceae bacterium]
MSGGAAARDSTAVQLLARFAVGCRDNELGDEIAADVTGRLLDVLGNCLAGRAETDGREGPDQAVLRVLASWGGAAESSVIGSDERWPAPNAALANGTFAHLLDFDDTHLPSVLHPSANIVPAALAVAEATGANTAQLLAAIAAGIEITNRLGMASYLPEDGNSLFFEKGFHATSICGTVGAAAAAGLLYGLDETAVSSAMGIASSMGAGIIEANRTGGTVKRIHCGWAAHAGVTAAALAREGVTGPPTVLEGRFGFFQAYLDGRYDAAALLDDLGTRWELLRTVYKPYPSNHFTHPGIDCALALRAAGLEPADVVAIELGVAAPVLRTIAEPRAEKVRPLSGYHAKFSGPYTVARALVGGGGLGLHLDDFTPASVADPQVLALSQRVDVVADERATALFPTAFAAVVRVETRSGRRVEHRVDSSRGGPENPLSRAEVLEKFRLNSSRALGAAQTDELLGAVDRMTSDTASIPDLLRMTRKDGR